MVTIVVPATGRSTSSLLPAVVAAVVAAGLVARYWGSPAAWWVGPATVVGVVGAAGDLRVRRVPNVLTAVGLAVVALALVLVQVAIGEQLLFPAVLGLLIWASPLFLTHVVTRGRTPGLGDVKLAGVLGLAAGGVHPMVAYVALVLSLLGGAVVGAGWRLTGRGRSFPLAPALTGSFVVVLAVWPSIGGATAW